MDFNLWFVPYYLCSGYSPNWLNKLTYSCISCAWPWILWASSLLVLAVIFILLLYILRSIQCIHTHYLADNNKHIVCCEHLNYWLEYLINRAHGSKGQSCVISLWILGTVKCGGHKCGGRRENYSSVHGLIIDDQRKPSVQILIYSPLGWPLINSSLRNFCGNKIQENLAVIK